LPFLLITGHQFNHAAELLPRRIRFQRQVPDANQRIAGAQAIQEVHQLRFLGLHGNQLGQLQKELVGLGGGPAQALDADC